MRDLSIGYRVRDHREHNGKREIVIASGLTERVEKGELTSLLGPNGAGKSTLMRTASGFIPALAGEIFINGRNLKSLSPKELAQSLSVVLTERPTAENMRVEEMVALGRSPYTGFFGRLTAEDHKIVREAISLTGIEELKDRKVVTLSDGERQKCMIAKALAQQTPVIFLDEPTAFLDYPSKAETFLLLKKLCKETGKSILLTTHDLEIALQLSDRLWLLSKENGLTTGTPASLGEDGSIARYFDSASINYDSTSRRFRVRSLKNLKK